MAELTLFTVRIDGINGYVSLPVANSTLFWRDASGVLGVLPTSTFALAASLPGKANLAGGNTFSGDQIFEEDVTISGSLSANNFSGSSSGNNTGDQDISGKANLGGGNNFTGSQEIDGSLGVQGDFGVGGFSSFFGPMTLGVGVTFTYGTGVAALHRTALGLGTLATQNGIFSGTSSGNNTGDQDLSGYGQKASENSWPEANDFSQLFVNAGGILQNAGHTIYTSSASFQFDFSAKEDFIASLELDTRYQPKNANLTSWAGVTRASGFDTAAAVPLGNNGSFYRVNTPLLASGIRTAISVKTTTYTAVASDHTIFCNSSSGSFTLNLPASSSVAGAEYIIIKTSADANTVTIDPNGSETIGGALTYPVMSQNQVVRIQNNGSNWFVTSEYIP